MNAALSSASSPSPSPTEKVPDFVPVFSYSRIVVTLLPHPNSIATMSSDFDWYIAFKALLETNSVADIGNITFKKKGTLADSVVIAARFWRTVRDDSVAKLNRKCGCFSGGAIMSSKVSELKDGFIEFPADPAYKMVYAGAGKEGVGVTIGLLVKIDSENIIENATLGFDIKDDRRSFGALVSDGNGIHFEWPNMEYAGLPFEGPLLTIEKMLPRT